MTKLIEMFNNLQNDKERWKFVIENKENFRIRLDNDQTTIIDKAVDDEETYHDDIQYDANFDDYIGNGQGAHTLLEVIGINSEAA